jgi:hypothetical protein
MTNKIAHNHLKGVYESQALGCTYICFMMQFKEMYIL